MKAKASQTTPTSRISWHIYRLRVRILQINHIVVVRLADSSCSVRCSTSTMSAVNAADTREERDAPPSTERGPSAPATRGVSRSSHLYAHSSCHFTDNGEQDSVARATRPSNSAPLHHRATRRVLEQGDLARSRSRTPRDQGLPRDPPHRSPQTTRTTDERPQDREDGTRSLPPRSLARARARSTALRLSRRCLRRARRAPDGSVE